jgi:hypothetical protein
MTVENNLVTIYFSKNRPLQLDLALNTNKQSCLEWENQNQIVLYKATSDRFTKAYEQLKREHPSVTFIKQVDFKKDLLKCLKRQKYVLFVVDDCIFTGDYSSDVICLALDTIKNALGFSLRLGTNTKYCYSLNKSNKIPEIKTVVTNLRKFNWTNNASGDFAYPLELSSSAYRIDDIIQLLEQSNYDSPNSLEWLMYVNLNFFKEFPVLLCYETSVAFCNPINKVQTENNNRSGKKSEYTLESLLKRYEKGERINSKMFYGFVSGGCHQETDIEFSSLKKESL